MQLDQQTTRRLASLRSQVTYAMDRAHSFGRSITLGETRQQRQARLAEYEDSLEYLQGCRDRLAELETSLRDSENVGTAV
ncbi:MAG: hypothetical protein EPN36_14385 [Rhodanobacteraceae bacterium]|nr:MAG: hypothetical protein EPN36_14385 [Rhodanobacteraceae bacterium]